MLNELEQALGTLLAEPARADLFAFCEAQFVADGSWQDLIGLYETFGAPFGPEGRVDWARLIERLESMAAALSVEERSQLFETIGQLWEARLGRPEQALRQYQAAFKLWPKNRAALARARGIYAGQGNWRLVTRLLELELHAVTEPLVQAELLVALGEAALNGGPDAERALGYLERAAQLAPTFEGVGRLASRLAALPAEGVAAQPSPEVHEAAVEDARAPAETVASAGPVAAAAPTEPKLKWKLSPALTALRSAAAGESVAPVRRARRSDPASLAGLDRAALESLWATGEDDLGVLDALAKRYRDVGDLASLAACYEAAVKGLVWQESAKELMIDAGRFYWQELGDMEAAERMFKRVRLLDGREVTTLTFFAELARREGDPRRLLVALQSLREVTVDQAAWLEVGEELAGLAAMDARTHDKAVDVWRQILRRSPRHAAARAALQELLTTTGRWSTLLEVLKDDLALADAGEDQVRILESMAEVYRERLNLPFMVAQTLQSILKIAPGHVEAAWALGERFASAGRWSDAVTMMMEHASHASRPEEATRALRWVVEIWSERLRQPWQAIGALEQLLELQPRDALILSELRRAFSERGAWGRLVELLERQALRSGGAERAELLEEAAAIASTTLRDDVVCARIHETLLSDSEGRADASFAFLAGYLPSEELWPRWAQSLMLRRGAVDGEMQVALAMEEAEVRLVRLSDRSAAERLWLEAARYGEPGQAGLARLIASAASSGRWQMLMDLGDEFGCWSTLRASLMARLSNCGSDQVQEIGEALWEIASNRLSHAEAEREVLEAWRKRSPRNLVVLERLDQRYQWAGEVEPRAEVLADLVPLVSAERGLALCDELSAICERDLGDARRSYQWAAQAFVRTASEPDRLARVTELAVAVGEVRSWVSMLEAVASGLSDAEHSGRVRAHAAALCDEALNEPLRAAAMIETVRASGHADAALLGRLCGIYARVERWAPLAAALEAQAALTWTVSERASVELELAQVLSERLGRLAEASKLLLAQRDEGVASAKSQELLLSVSMRRADWAVASQCLESAVERAGESERGAFLVEWGRLLSERLGEHRQAISVFGRAIEDGSDAGGLALSGLVAMFGRADVAEAAATVAAPYLGKAGLWAELLQAYGLMRFAVGSGERRATSRAMAEIWEREFSDPDSAFIVIANLLVEEVGEVCDWVLFDRLAAASGRSSEGAVRWLAALEQFGAAPFAPHLAEIARLVEAELGDADAARGVWQKATSLRSEPSDWLEVARLSEALGDWTAARAAWMQVARIASNEASQEAVVQAAMLADAKLADPESAIEELEQLLASDVHYAPARKQLRSLLERVGKPDRLAWHLEQWADYADSEQNRLALLRQAAAASEAALAWHGAARLHCLVVAGVAGTGDAASEAEAFWRRAGGAGVWRTADDVGLLDLLCGGHRSAGRYEALWSLLDVALHQAAASRRLSLADACAEVAEEQLQRADAAMDARLVGYRLSPDDPARSAAVELAAEQSNRWEDVAVAYEWAAEQTTDGPKKAGRLRAAALIRLERLNDLPSAIANFEIARQFVPHDRELLQSLEKLFAASGNAELRAVVVLECAGLTDEADERARLLLEAAAIFFRELGAHASAVAVLADARRYERTHDEALLMLAEIHTSVGSWSALAEVLQAQLSVAPEDGSRAELLARLAALYDEKLGMAREALDAWSDYTELRADDRAAWSSMERLAGALGDGVRRVTVLERLLALSSESEGQAVAWALAQQQVAASGDLHRGIDLAAALLSSAIYVERAEGLLRGLWSHDDVGARARSVMIAHYDRVGDAEALVEALTAEASADTRVEERVATLVRATRVCLATEGMADRGFALVMFAVELAPLAAEVVELSEAAAEAVQGWSALAEALSEIVHRSEDGYSAAQVSLRVAGILDHRMGLSASALDWYVAVSRALPLEVTSRRRLAVLLSEAARLPEEFAVIAELVELAVSEEERAALLQRAAELGEELGQSPESLLELWRRRLSIVSGDRSALVALSRLELKLGNHASAASWMGQELEVIGDSAEASALRLRLATLVWHELGSASRCMVLVEAEDRAFGVSTPFAALLIEVLESDAVMLEERMSAVALLEPFARVAHRADALEVALRNRVPFAAGTELSELHCELALLYRDRLSRRSDGCRSFVAAALLQPELASNWRDADESADDESLREVVRQALERAADEANRAELRAELWERLARFAQDRMEDPLLALRGWSAAFDATPGTLRVMDEVERRLAASGQQAARELVLRRGSDAATEPTVQRAILLRLAEVRRRESQDLEGAVSVCREILSRFGSAVDVLTMLSELLSELQRPGELVETLHALASLMQTAEERVMVLLCLGTVLDESLQDWAGCHAAYEKALTEDVLLVRVLEAVLQTLTRVAERAADQSWVVAFALLAERAAREDAAIRVEMLLLQLSVAEERPLRSMLTLRLSAAMAAAGRPAEEQFGYLSRALLDAPEQVELGVALSTLCRAHEAMADYARVLEEAAMASSNLERSVALLTEAGMVRLMELGDSSGAVRTLRRAFDADPSLVGSAEALRAALQMSGDRDGLMHLNGRILESGPSAEVRAALLRDAAKLAEQPPLRLEAACGLWSKVLSMVPDDVEAVEALVRLLPQANRWDELGELHARRALSSEGDAAASSYAELGRIRLVQGRFQDAVEAYQAVLSIRADDRAVMLPLLQAYRALGYSSEWLAVADRYLAGAGFDEEAVTLRLETARVAMEELGDALDAALRLRPLVGRGIQDGRLVGQLQVLLQAPAARSEVLGFARGYLLENGELAARVALTVAAAEESPDMEVQAELFERAASLLDREEGLASVAVVLRVRALSAQPASERLRAELLGSLRERSSMVEAVRALDLASETAGDAASGAMLVELAATICGSLLGDDESAEARHRLVVSQLPSHTGALRSLAALCGRAGRRIEELAWLEMLAGFAGTPMEAAEAWMAVHDGAMASGEPQRAVQAVANALRVEPATPRARDLLRAYAQYDETALSAVPLLIEFGRSQRSWEDLDVGLTMALDALEGAGLREPLLREQMLLRSESLDDGTGALERALEILAYQPLDLPALEIVFANAVHSGAVESVIERSLAVLEGRPAGMGDSAVIGWIVRLAGAHAVSSSTSTRCARLALFVSSTDPAALLLLERGLRQNRDETGLMSLLESRVEGLEGVARLPLFDELLQLGSRLDVAPSVRQNWARAAYRLEPTEARYGALSEILAESGDARGVAELGLERLEQTADLEDRRQLRLLVSHQFEAGCGDTAAAARLIADALAEEPRDASLRRELARLLRSAGEGAALVAVCDEGAQLAQGSDRTAWQLEKARAEALVTGDVRAAADTAAAAFAAAPDDNAAFEAWAGYLEKLDARAELRTALLARAEQEGGSAAAVGWRLKAALALPRSIENDLTAEAELRGLLEVAPNDEEAHAALGSLFAAAERWSELRELLSARLSRQPTAVAEGSTFELLKACLTALGDDAELFGLYRLRVLAAAGDLEAVMAFEQLARSLGSWDDVYLALCARGGLATTATERAEALREAAAVAWDKLRDAVRAVDAMGGARMLLPDDTALCEAQLALLAEAGMFEQAEALLPGYDALLERNGQGADRHRVSFLRGQWLLARGELAAGRVVLEESFEMNGTSIPTILALGALLRQLGEREESLRVLQTGLLYQHSIQDPAVKVELFCLLGHLRNEVGDPRRAREMFSRALALDPEHAESLAALDQLPA
jgi:hypothetical protein